MAGVVLFTEFFEIKNINPEGKVFDKVSRLECQGENFEMLLMLDINTDIYKLNINDKFTFSLATSLSLDGTGHEDYFDQSGTPSIADKYEYVMYGQVYKYAEEKGGKVSVYASFGGLLMMLSGDPKNLQDIELDSHVYLLMRKLERTSFSRAQPLGSNETGVYYALVELL